MAACKSSRCRASWCAIVVTKADFLRLPTEADQDAKKKVAPKTPSAEHRSATDPITAVFPEPAGPVTHFIFLGCSNVSSPLMIQSYRSSWTATRVLGWHFGASQRSAESWMAPATALDASSTRLVKINHRCWIGQDETNLPFNGPPGEEKEGEEYMLVTKFCSPTWKSWALAKKVVVIRPQSRGSGRKTKTCPLPHIFMVVPHTQSICKVFVERLMLI